MSLRKNTIANYLGQGWTALMGLAFVPLYIKYLGIEAWGLVGFMSMLQAWLTLLDMGLTPTLSREMARFQAGEHSAQSIRDLLRSLELIYASIALCIVVGVWLASPWLASHWLSASHLSDIVLSQAIAMMGFVLATRMVEQVYRGAIQGLQRQVWLNGAQSLLATLRWAGVVGVLIWVDSSIGAFFLWQGLVSLLTVVVFACQTYRYLPLALSRARFDSAGIIRIRHFAGGMMLTTFLALLLTQVDKLMLSKLVSLEEFGVYTLAGSVSGALYFLVMPISNAVSPLLTELVANSEHKALVDTYHRACQWTAVVLIPIALIMAAFAEPLMLVWTNSAELARHASPFLAYLALGTLCNGFLYVPYSIQLAHGWTGFAVRVNIIAVIFIIPAIFWTVPRFGAVGAAWVWLTLNLGYLLIGMQFMHRRILPSEKWRWYRDSVIKPILVGGGGVIILRECVVLPVGRLPMAISLICLSIFLMFGVMWSTPISRKVLKLNRV